MAYESEAVLAITARMRDDASAKMQNLGKTMQEQQKQALNLHLALTTVGTAMTAMGSLANRLDNPLAKLASTFLLTGGAIFSTTSAILQMIPQISKLITWLRGLAIAQAVVSALSGPGGIATLGVGLAVAAGATAGVYALTRTNAGERGGAPPVNIYSQAFTGNDVEARTFGRKLQTIAREDTRLGR